MEYIKLYENALSSEKCDEVIRFFENHKERHYDGLLGKNGVYNKNYKTCKEMHLAEMQEEFNHHLEEYYQKYVSSLSFFDYPDLRNERWRIKKYNQGEGFFNWHIDTSNKKRVIAVIYYLNDVYVGGETVFKIDDKFVSIQPKKGNLLMFPANFCYVHKGNVPLSGDKYILVTFLNITDLN